MTHHLQAPSEVLHLILGVLLNALFQNRALQMGVLVPMKSGSPFNRHHVLSAPLCILSTPPYTVPGV